MGGRRSWSAILLGLVIAAIGIVLGIGGAWLAVLGGSLYYLVVGIAMLAAGVQLMRSRMIGAYVYIGVVAVTVPWAFVDAHSNLVWALVPRIVAPIVLLIATFLVMPTLTRAPNRWKLAGGGVAAVIAATAVLFTVLGSQDSTVAALPAQNSIGMGDPSGTATGADWPAYGGTGAARRYSPLTQIDAGNVGQLQQVWLSHTGDMPATPAAAKMYGAETTPLKIGDALYLCSAKNIMISLDAATGKERWRFDPKVADEWIPYTAACRGVSYYKNPVAKPGDACAERVIEGTLDARLVAVDVKDGKPCADFGANGQVDAKIGMGKVFPGLVSINSPPVIIRGIAVTGHQTTDGQERWEPSGVIQGFDAVTGKLRFAWDMKHPEWNGYPPAGQEWSRGTPNMWTIASGDEQLGLVYLPMGNSTVDYWSTLRSPIENSFGTSIVALDVTTGKPRWKFQAVKNDVWDYDFGSQPSLIDYKGTPALLVASKQGDMYVLDRATGRPLTPVGTIKAPGGGIEPGQRSPTQIVSLWQTLRKDPLTESDMWGMSPIDQMICRINFRRASYKGFFTPPEVDRHSIEYPGYNGGSDWGSLAVDPARGVIVANYNDMPNYNRLVPRVQADKQGWFTREQKAAMLKDGKQVKVEAGAEGAGDPQAGTPYAIDVNAGWQMPFTGMLCKQPPYGGIRAIDIATGKTIWDRPFGSARKNGPFGIPSYLPFTIGTPNNGGSVVTAGGVIFVAAATDDLFKAIDIKTGKILWQVALPAGGQATPMVYEQNGREYVVLMTGGHHFMKTPIGDQVIAWALPAN
ncbi:membrane-bound PQQ-dependent dehydrogenase, glucose/quinate/shikimate family [Sphingomonas immobilis]|uniref:Membrane-bound PQQ-dependent dehydrogenase, glucose/quinate/shikimate family n=1 Tax=Sphingomonas immobilis TaxID=3063997 RepID=A0ABT8ZYL1_9SPHN|nr:membrane-bound PQQ-dependent dehydrogenase, glucose/quinate/shikimate family [Sphingomonas sp. CA1-15]MDO7842671.1 membrane-bound PQQ-dependent dehydrogenase, glucose/quinate/shikimate family [Sphingomonas sp. CA1-15]